MPEDPLLIISEYLYYTLMYIRHTLTYFQFMMLM